MEAGVLRPQALQLPPELRPRVRPGRWRAGRVEVVSSRTNASSAWWNRGCLSPRLENVVPTMEKNARPDSDRIQAGSRCRSHSAMVTPYFSGTIWPARFPGSSRCSEAPSAAAPRCGSCRPRSVRQGTGRSSRRQSAAAAVTRLVPPSSSRHRDHNRRTTHRTQRAGAATRTCRSCRGRPSGRSARPIGRCDETAGRAASGAPSPRAGQLRGLRTGWRRRLRGTWSRHDAAHLRIAAESCRAGPQGPRRRLHRPGSRACRAAVLHECCADLAYWPSEPSPSARRRRPSARACYRGATVTPERSNTRAQDGQLHEAPPPIARPPATTPDRHTERSLAEGV
jgi:hypothetical protein